MYDDSKIWEDFRKGMDYALKHIYDQYVLLLYRYGKKITGDDEIIKDSIQDMFYDLIRTRKNLGDTDSIKFYLIIAFRRKLVQNIKKQRFYDVFEEEKIVDKETIGSAEGKMIDEEEITRRSGSIRKAMQKLSVRQREILFYRFHCDFDYDQICEIMSLKYDSARKLSFRALKILREYLKAEPNKKLR